MERLVRAALFRGSEGPMLFDNCIGRKRDVGGVVLASGSLVLGPACRVRGRGCSEKRLNDGHVFDTIADWLLRVFGTPRGGLGAGGQDASVWNSSKRKRGFVARRTHARVTSRD